MSLETIERTSNPWEYMCERWEKFAPPGRPSQDDISKFRQILHDHIDSQNLNIANVLVLGATPEIRDMLAENPRIDVTIADITIDMIISMTQLMRNKTSREAWVKSNWITAPLKDGHFDAVISDLVICNVDERQHKAFYEKILTLLKPDGHWINRVYSVDGNTSIRSLDSLLDEYSHKQEITKEDINNFRSTAGLIAWDRDRRILDWSLLYKAMCLYRKDDRFIHENIKYQYILNETYELFKPFDKIYFLATDNEMDESFNAFFRINRKIPDDSVSHLKEKAYYIYDLMKKQ